MPTLDTLTALAGAATIAVVLYHATRARAPGRNDWLLPAGVGLLFLGWTVHAIAGEGLFGFWDAHTASRWGYQVGTDLFIAVATALVFMLPRARALGMAPLPWALGVLLTGSIGLMALAARIAWLAPRVAAGDAVAPGRAVDSAALRPI